FCSEPFVAVVFDMLTPIPYMSIYCLIFPVNAEVRGGNGFRRLGPPLPPRELRRDVYTISGLKEAVYPCLRFRIGNQRRDFGNLRRLSLVRRPRQAALGGKESGFAISRNFARKLLEPAPDLLFRTTQDGINDTAGQRVVGAKSFARQDQPPGNCEAGNLAQ